MRIGHRTREALTGYGFVIIWVVGFLIFTLIPLIRTFWFSMNEVKVTTEGIKTNFIGLTHYRNALFMDVQFGDIIINYLIQMVVYVPVIILFSL